jgi:hypothetical protein
MADVEKIVIERFTNLFGEPKTPNPVGFIAEYEHALSGYSAGLLRRAVDSVIAEHRFSTWPTIGKVKGAADSLAISDVDHQRGPSTPERREDPMWGAEAFAMADQMIRCSMGYQAAKEGWCLGLHEFLRRHGRLPHLHEAERIQANARFVDACVRGDEELGQFAKSVREFSLQIARRRDELAKAILTGSLWEKSAGAETLSERSRRMMGETE